MVKDIHYYNKEMDDVLAKLKEGKIELKLAKELLNGYTKRTKQAIASVTYHQIIGEVPVCEFLSLGNMKKISGEKEASSVSNPKMIMISDKKTIDWSLLGKSINP